jgi:hypothetical protein
MAVLGDVVAELADLFRRKRMPVPESPAVVLSLGVF